MRYFGYIWVILNNFVLFGVFWTICINWHYLGISGYFGIFIQLYFTKHVIVVAENTTN